jgi:hypothetical protein
MCGCEDIAYNEQGIGTNKKILIMWLETLLVLCLGMTPPLLSLWYTRKAQHQIHESLVSARNRVVPRPNMPPSELPRVSLRILGDYTCEYNARSPYLRCAINPEGPCHGCKHYTPRDS